MSKHNGHQDVKVFQGRSRGRHTLLVSPIHMLAGWVTIETDQYAAGSGLFPALLQGEGCAVLSM